MTLKDKHGWPIELWTGRPVKNAVRLVCQWVRGNWYGGSRNFRHGHWPEVVCLCGSTRFMDAFHDANRRLSLAGKIVLTVEVVTYDGATDPQRADPEQKRRLDELHLRKIDLADRVLILNVGGYIGESTKRELEYAQSHRKIVQYLECPVRSQARYSSIIIDDCIEGSNEQ